MTCLTASRDTESSANVGVSLLRPLSYTSNTSPTIFFMSSLSHSVSWLSIHDFIFSLSIGAGGKSGDASGSGGDVCSETNSAKSA